MWDVLRWVAALTISASLWGVAWEIHRFLRRRPMGRLDAPGYAISTVFGALALASFAWVIPTPWNILVRLGTAGACVALWWAVRQGLHVAGRLPTPAELRDLLEEPEGRATLERIAAEYAPRGSDAGRGRDGSPPA